MPRHYRVTIFVIVSLFLALTIVGCDATSATGYYLQNGKKVLCYPQPVWPWETDCGFDYYIVNGTQTLHCTLNWLRIGDCPVVTQGGKH